MCVCVCVIIRVNTEEEKKTKWQRFEINILLLLLLLLLLSTYIKINHFVNFFHSKQKNVKKRKEFIISIINIFLPDLLLFLFTIMQDVEGLQFHIHYLSSLALLGVHCPSLLFIILHLLHTMPSFPLLVLLSWCFVVVVVVVLVFHYHTLILSMHFLPLHS